MNVDSDEWITIPKIYGETIVHMSKFIRDYNSGLMFLPLTKKYSIHLSRGISVFFYFFRTIKILEYSYKQKKNKKKNRKKTLVYALEVFMIFYFFKHSMLT
jgi:hypothetical protein